MDGEYLRRRALEIGLHEELARTVGDADDGAH
jgi:hypothetical protein